MVKASRIKSTKKNSKKSRKNKKVKAGGGGVVPGDGGDVGEFEDVAFAVPVLDDEGNKKKKTKITRADSTTGEGVTVAVNLAAEGKKKRKKKNKKAEGVVAGVDDIVADDDVVCGDDVVAGDDHDLVAGDDAYVMAGDDMMTGDDVVVDDDVVVYDDVAAGDVVAVEADEGATVVVVADESKKKKGKKRVGNVKGIVAVGEGLGEAGMKRKKPSWEYVPIVPEVKEQLPPKRCRPVKKDVDFVTY